VAAGLLTGTRPARTVFRVNVEPFTLRPMRGEAKRRIGGGLYCAPHARRVVLEDGGLNRNQRVESLDCTAVGIAANLLQNLLDVIVPGLVVKELQSLRHIQVGLPPPEKPERERAAVAYSRACLIRGLHSPCLQ